MSWRTLARSHAHLIAAAGFFTAEVWTARGLVRQFTLLVIDIASRRVHIAGTRENPDSPWMEQIARNLTDCEAGFLVGKHFLITDRDAILSPKFKSIPRDSGLELLVTAHQAPNMHLGIGNEILGGVAPQADGNVEVNERLAGLLKHRYRKAA
jgi:putative transposase